MGKNCKNWPKLSVPGEGYSRNMCTMLNIDLQFLSLEAHLFCLNLLLKTPGSIFQLFKRLINCCLTLSEQNFSYIMSRTTLQFNK